MADRPFHDKRTWRNRAEQNVAERLRSNAYVNGFEGDDELTDDDQHEVSDLSLSSENNALDSDEPVGIAEEDEEAMAVEVADDAPQGVNCAGSASGADVSASDTSDSLEIVLSHGSSSGIDEEAVDDYLLRNLQEWGVSGVSKRKVDELLTRLRPIHRNLPRSYKTLLHTPRLTRMIEAANGYLWYKGIKTNLDILVTDSYLNEFGRIMVDISMDGLPLYRSSHKEFWPILGRLENDSTYPFTIGVWFGDGKPASVDEYLHMFISEVEQLSAEGYECDNTVYPFSIKNYICDAVARAFIKCYVGHNGTHGSEKCVVNGTKFMNVTTFPALDAPLRSDESFRNRSEPRRHTGNSPLERVNTGMVSQFRLDYQHLLCHGAFKRQMKQLLCDSGTQKLSREDVSSLSAEMKRIIGFIPRGFARKPRSMKHFLLFKATELRQLLKYTGLIVFKHILPENLYKNYLLLHAPSYILASPKFVPDKCDLAKHLLTAYVQHSMQIYGNQFCSYNVRSLIHLPDECRTYGPLDNFSTFPYENQLQIIKRTLRSTYKPLQQLANRDAENDGVLKRKKPKQDGVRLSRPHNGVIDLKEIITNLSVNGVTFTVDKADSTFKSKQGSVVVLKDIVETANGIVLCGHEFSRKENFYDYPVPSSQLGILKVSDLHEMIRRYRVKDIGCTCVLIPDKPPRHLMEEE